MPRWGMGWFVKMHCYSNFIEDRDTIYCITGREGAGKSSCALSIAKYVDSTFEKNMENRLLFTEEDLDIFIKFQKERAKMIENGEVVKPWAFIVDEGQNILFSRSSMTRKQKQLIKLFRTMRFTNSFIIICTPNILEIDKAVLSRINAGAVISNNKEDVFISIRDFNEYYGKFDDMIEYLFEYRKSKKVTIPMQPKTIERICKSCDILWKWDAFGKTKHLKSLYERYRILKASKALEMQIVEDEKEDGGENITANNEKKQEQKKENSIIEKIKAKLSNEIKDECFDLVTDEYYINCYYRKQVLAKIFCVSQHTINKYALKCRKKKIGNKIYIHFGDMLAQLEKI